MNRRKLCFAFFFLNIFFCSALISCASTKIEVSKKTVSCDGIYSYDFERVTESIQSEILYRSSGVEYSLYQTKNSTGNAVAIFENRFWIPEFIETKQMIEILPDGKLYSPTNQTLSGKILPDGRIFWSGTFEEHGQTILITESARLTKKSENQLAPSSLNGIYTLTQKTDKFEFILKDGLATSEFGNFIVDQNGEFSSTFSLNIIQKLQGSQNASTLADFVSAGKVLPDGKISYQTGTSSGSNLSSSAQNVVLSGVKTMTLTEDYVPEIQQNVKFEPLLKDENQPEWFSFIPVEKDGKLIVCAKKSAKSKAVAEQIAVTCALAEISAQKAIRISSQLEISNSDASSANSADSKKSQKFFETLETQSLENVDYKILNSHADKASKTFYVQIESAL